MKFRIIIWVFTVCKSTRLWVSRIQRVAVKLKCFNLKDIYFLVSLTNDFMSFITLLVRTKTSHKEGLKAAYSVTMNIFRKKIFSFKSFVKVELSYAFAINMFTGAENCTEK